MPGDRDLKFRQPRRTPLGGRRVGNEFWFVSEYGEKSQYVRNILAHNEVRVRIKTLPRLNSAGVRTLGSNLLTLRVDLT